MYNTQDTPLPTPERVFWLFVVANFPALSARVLRARGQLHDRVFLCNYNGYQPPSGKTIRQVEKDKKIMDDIYYKP